LSLDVLNSLPESSSPTPVSLLSNSDFATENYVLKVL
jgi:hypothetical protein